MLDISEGKVFLGDCLDLMQELEPESVDLILTDPPYVISRKTGFASGGPNSVDRFRMSMEFGEWDERENFTLKQLKEFSKQSYRVLRKGGTVVCFYDLWKIQELSEVFSDAKFKQLRFIEWIKTNPVPLNSKRNYLTNSREVAVTAVKGGKPIFNSEYDNGVYEYPIYHSSDRFHPTQKPIKLFEELIRKHSNGNSVILDPFLGSGTTLVAANNLGRSAFGFEKNPEFFEKIRIRLNH